MDIDELKSLWQRHDRQLEDSLMLNVQILRQMKMSRTNSEFRKLMNFEICSVVAGFVVAAVMAWLTSAYILSPLYALCGVVACGIMLMYLVFSMIRLTGFSALCGYDDSVVKAQKELAFQKRRMLRLRRVELITMPVCFVAVFPLLADAVYGFDILQYPGRYATGVAVACIITIPLVVWIYRVFYEKRIASAEALLRSIAEFEDNV